MMPDVPGVEILRYAVSRGYYATPRQCRLKDLAAERGVSPAAIHTSLVRAERHAITWYLRAAAAPIVPDDVAVEPSHER